MSKIGKSTEKVNQWLSKTIGAGGNGKWLLVRVGFFFGVVKFF